MNSRFILLKKRSSHCVCFPLGLNVGCDCLILQKCLRNLIASYASISLDWDWSKGEIRFIDDVTR